MKHDEIYDKHSDHRKSAKTPKKKDKKGDPGERKSRVSFKNYVRQLRDDELANEDPDDLDSGE
jgi:hypothetical protein